MTNWKVPPNYAVSVLRTDARTNREIAKKSRDRGAADAVIAYYTGCADAVEELLKHIERETTLIESLDALATIRKEMRA